MSLPAGTRLGPYEIITPLGAGGMGEVYRAHDSRLGRDVAIKVTKEEFSERFAREARAIAALNHTNVCQLIDGIEATHEKHIYECFSASSGSTLDARRAGT